MTSRKTTPVRRKATPDQRTIRQDDWQNALTGLGLLARDKRLSAVQVPTEISYQEADDLWAGDDMAARIVELPPDEMCREGWELGIQEDKDAAEVLAAKSDDLGVEQAVHAALCQARAFGGAGILVGADDGGRPWQPLNLDRIKTVGWLTVLDAYELQPASWYEDPGAPKYGLPRTYRINTLTSTERQAEVQSGSLVHESRILRFDGAKTTRLRARRRLGWGDSIFVRLLAEIRDFQGGWDGTAHLLTDHSQGVLKVKDLIMLLAKDGGRAALQERMLALDMARSIARAIVVDADGEDFERKTTPLSGLDLILEKFMQRLAAAAGMPVTLLMGQSPAGLNATGDADLRYWYAKVRASQRTILLPALNRLTRILMRAKDSPTGGQEPENWSITFRPLWALTDTEQADLRNKQADTDSKYITAGVLTPEEVAVSRFGGDQYSTETTIDLAAREALAQAEPDREELPTPGLDPNAKAPGQPGEPNPEADPEH